jgi:hypothetical protein
MRWRWRLLLDQHPVYSLEIDVVEKPTFAGIWLQLSGSSWCPDVPTRTLSLDRRRPAKINPTAFSMLVLRVSPCGAVGLAESDKWFWSVNTSPFPAPPPNNGIAKSLEEAKHQFKQRYEEMNARGVRPSSDR